MNENGIDVMLLITDEGELMLTRGDGIGMMGIQDPATGDVRAADICDLGWILVGMADDGIECALVAIQ